MKVEILLDSINPFNGIRLTTFSLEYPQNIHHQLLTHRVFSRNSMSLRAMSFERVSELPIAEKTWTLEKKGMSGELASSKQQLRGNQLVDSMKHDVMFWCRLLALEGFHHQDINDYLRPFLNIQVVLSSTEWDNWFALRLDKKNAKPDIYKLALAMKEAMEESKPQNTYFHIPALNDKEKTTLGFNTCRLLSAARLARYSYMKFTDDIEADIKLANKLITNKHASPFEHIATAVNDEDFHNNYRGWIQFRQELGL